MRVIFMGTPEFAVPALRALAARHKVLCAYSQPPRPAGRGKKERKSAVQIAAEALGLPVRHPLSLRDAAANSAFAALDADVAVVVAYGLLLPAPILSAPRHGCLNIHASLLPRWRGAAPIHRAIMAGDAETGVAIMQMDEGLDTGPVRLAGRCAIGAEETTGDLQARLATCGAELIVRVLDDLDGLPPVPQPDTGATYARKIDKSEARIDWTAPAPEVTRRILGLSPHPGAWCDIAGERVKLLRARVAEGAAPAGTVLGGLRIACGTGAVEILEAQRPGKRAMAAAELMNGLTLPAGLD